MCLGERNILNDTNLDWKNITYHKSVIAIRWFTNENIDLIDWPAQSLDLNPIDNLLVT